MFLTIFLTIIPLLYSKKIHQFWAEHNFICSVCESGVSYTCLGGSLSNFNGCIDDTNNEYTPICKYLYKNENNIKLQCNQHSTYDICKSLNLCDNWIDDKFDKIKSMNIKLINKINNIKNINWKSGINDRFIGLTYGDIKRTTLGAVVDEKHVYKLKNVDYGNVKAPPSSFDTRQQWPKCANIVGNIRDQSACGCCWAFGSTEAFNDRVCITSLNTTSIYSSLLSVEDTCACCTGAECGYSNGCNGGQPTSAWNWFKYQGVPTGGNYSDLNKNDTCEPYTLPPCAHHESSQEYPNCPSREYKTPSCVKSCINKDYPITWENDKKYSQGSYSVRGITNIETEISTYGSVSAAFTVYEDFLTYKSGVYKHTSGSAVGGHAIKIIGYGNENGQDYWLCANSWNDNWGLNGYFKILKGVNECGIESNIGAGHPKIV